jgi:hypothetical protein
MSRPFLFRHDARSNAQKINRRIRRLMSTPASRKRTAEYERLLVLWAQATTEDEFEQAA